MGNRLVPIMLIALLAIMQAQLWLGRGGCPVLLSWSVS